MRLKVGKFYDNSFGDVFHIVGQDEDDEFVDHCGMKYNYRGESLFMSDYKGGDFFRSDKYKLRDLLSPLRELKVSFFQRITLTDTKERAEKAFQSMKNVAATKGLKDGEFEEIIYSETRSLNDFNAIKAAQFVALENDTSNMYLLYNLSLTQLTSLSIRVLNMKFYSTDSCDPNLRLYLDILYNRINGMITSMVEHQRCKKIKSQRPWQVYMKSVKARRDRNPPRRNRTPYAN